VHDGGSRLTGADQVRLPFDVTVKRQQEQQLRGRGSGTADNFRSEPDHDRLGFIARKVIHRMQPQMVHDEHIPRREMEQGVTHPSPALARKEHEDLQIGMPGERPR
jgi:hypothetical protein